MRSIIKNIWLALFFCSSVFATKSATHYLVPTNTSAANPYDSWETAGTSVIDVVKAAMTNSSSPRIVRVTNGVYVLTNSVTITNDVALKGVNGRDATIFNGNAAYRFVLQHTNCVLDGLTITNGYSTTGGGGIRMSGGTVTNCIITDCVDNGSGSARGGGIAVGGVSIIANSTIRRNIETSGQGGGGIVLDNGSTSTIQNCIIEWNAITNNFHGGGINIGYTAPLATTIRNCLIRYNYAGNYAGGIFFNPPATNVFVANCTIVSNYGGNNGGITFIGAEIKSNIVLNCIVISNKCPAASRNDIYDINNPAAAYAVAYSCSTANRTLILDYRGNKTNDPGFINFTGENYRVTSASPCFNSGTNQDWMIPPGSGTVDLDEHRRIDFYSGIVDMGCYEYVPHGTVYSVR